MSRPVAISTILVLAAGFVYVALRLFGIQFAAGVVYPEYSSLRSDPMGAKLLFDSLAGIAGVRAERNYLPLEYLPDRAATVLLLGTKPDSPDDSLKLLERAASRGDRIVVAFHFTADTKASDAKALEDAWHVKVEIDNAKARVHRFYFAGSKDWRVLDRAGPKALAIERDFGKGSVALFAESDDFTNQSTVAGDRLQQVSVAIGPNPCVVFDEQHLGIAEGGSVVDLARRFRLTGLMLGLGLLAGLFLWRNAAGFPPPVVAVGVERLSGRTSQAGLLTLLRRHVPPRELVAACWQEWLNANRGQVSSERIERAAQIARDRTDRPVDAVREIAAVLQAKGEL